MRFSLSQLTQMRREWISYVILIVSLLVTTGVITYYYQSIEQRDKLRFANAVQSTHISLNSRINTYTTLLRGSTGLFSAEHMLNQEQFKAFVDKIQIQSNYPGIMGIGYAKRFTAYDIATLPSSNVSLHPLGQRSEYNVIIFFEPQNIRNKNILGYDMYSDSIIKEAMNRARDTATPTLSGKVTLMKEIDDQQQTGFLIFVPFYHGSEIPETISERRELLEGFIYSPLRSSNFFQGIAMDTEPRVTFKVFDGNRSMQTNLLYDSSTYSKTIPDHYSPRFTKIVNVENGGQTWTIVYNSAPGLDSVAEHNIIPLLLLVGISGSFFLFSLSRMQYKARIRAERSENKLRLSEERYRRLIASTKVVPWEADVNSGNYTYVGEQAKQLLGYPVKDWYKNGFKLKRLHQDDTMHAYSLSNTLYKRKREYELDYRMVRKNGQIVWVHEIVAVVRKPDGTKMLSGILVDVTERELLVKQKDDFVSIATHELKTPVTSIKAFAQVLLKQFEKSNDKQSAEYLAKMENQLNKLISLIEDLLDVTRFENGGLRFQKEYFDSNELIMDIVEEVQLTTENHRIKTDLGKSQLLFGDRERIGQVLMNFLTNAVKYSPSANLIIVKTQVQKNVFLCSVQDFGIGIPKASQKKLFERFYRVNGPYENHIAGLGLGLYLSSEIIKRHNGTVRLVSSPKKGSTFSFSLPIKPVKQTRVGKT